MTVNRVFLIGRLGGEPELRLTGEGRAVLRMRLATTEQWTDREGRRQRRTDWHTVLLWGRRAEALQPWLRKGRRIGVEGRLRCRQWETAQGERRSSVEVEATQIVLLDGGRERGTAASGPAEPPCGDEPREPAGKGGGMWREANAEGERGLSSPSPRVP